MYLACDVDAGAESKEAFPLACQVASDAKAGRHPRLGLPPCPASARFAYRKLLYSDSPPYYLVICVYAEAPTSYDRVQFGYLCDARAAVSSSGLLLLLAAAL